MGAGFILQCSNCGRENPVAVGTTGGRMRCGGCPSLLIPANCLPQTVTDAGWEAEVLRSPVPVVAYFWGPNCAVCANYDLSVRKMAASLFPLARVVSLNAEANPATPKRYGLRGVPTLMVFKGGELVRTMEGPQGERTVREAIAQLA